MDTIFPTDAVYYLSSVEAIFESEMKVKNKISIGNPALLTIKICQFYKLTNTQYQGIAAEQGN
jgi:hypothetical protein